MTMKRMREDNIREVEALAMANCLMLLSRVGKTGSDHNGRVFACKTCNREFQSFQALGGHRASHKRPRLIHVQSPGSPDQRPKTHECSICGLEFTTGQALGGHMRKHRADDQPGKEEPVIMKKMGRSNSKRVLCLDLKLAPYDQYDKENVDLSLVLSR